MFTDDTAFHRLSDTIVAAILGHWDVGTDISVRRHGQGMKSATWLVTTPDGRWVAKAVPGSAAAQFDAGLLVAACIEAAGIPAGAPLPTIAGAVSTSVVGCWLALLRYVAGQEINRANPTEQRLWGATLARVHSLLQFSPLPPGVQSWHWVDPAAPHLDIEPWVRPAVRAAMEQLHALEEDVPLTIGIRPLPSQEMIALPDFLRFRWAVQADYFARRIWTNDLTGVIGPSENHDGLRAARHFLLGA